MQASEFFTVRRGVEPEVLGELLSLAVAAAERHITVVDADNQL